MPERSEMILSDGVRLHVEISGPADAPVTVVLLHGWCLDRRIWHHQVAALRDARVIAFDARGHGRSGSTCLRSATLAQLGDDLAEVLRQHAPTGPVILAGHSLGGMTVMEYAESYPEEFADRIAGVVFVSTTAEGHTHTHYGLPPQVAFLMRAGETVGAEVLARAGAWHPHRIVLPALRPVVRWLLFGDEYADAALSVTMKAFAHASLRSIGGFRASVGAQHRLDTLTALGDLPSAVLVGDRDRLTPPACAESIAGALAEAELTVYPGAGHMLMLERPDEVTAVLAAVMEQAVARTPVREGYEQAA